MSRRESENIRKISYLAEFDGIDEDSSENEIDKDKKEDQEEEVYGWDLFRQFPPKSQVGSMADMRLYEYALLFIKTLTYLFLLLLIIFCGILSKGSILFATAQIDRQDPLPYCNYSNAENKLVIQKSEATLPKESQLTWYWCILIAFCIPEVFSFISAIYHLSFKKQKILEWYYLIFISAIEGFHAGSMAVLFLFVLPKFNSVQAVTISSFTSFIPNLLGLLSRNKQQFDGSRYKLILMIIGDIVVLLIQVGGISIISMLSDIDDSIRWILPPTLLLVSCRWWLNYVSSNSQLGLIKQLSKLKVRLDYHCGIVQGITSLLRILAFFCTCLFILYWNSIDINLFFNHFPGKTLYNVTLHKDSNSIGEIVAQDVFDSSTVLITCLVHVFASYITYSSGKFANRTLMQRVGFALPTSLLIPLTILTVSILYLIRANNSCGLHYFFPDYLFFKTPNNTNDFQYGWLIWEYWAWIFIVIPQIWTTLHIWTPNCERLAATYRIFALPSYDSLIIDQSLVFNRRKGDEFNEDLEFEDDDKEMAPRFSDVSSTIKPFDRVTKIYACATMWHEIPEEMVQFINSILRLDLCQSAMRFTQKRYQVKIDDYFDLEVHIFFDDAFECMHGCSNVCSHDENETHVNDYVKSLIDTVKTSVESLGILAVSPMKYPAPYGGRLEWTLPGKNKLIVHLKDKNKIRHRKRWSQVMYMYYLLGYCLIDKPMHINRKAVIAENTFILTLDGDIDFKPSAVKVLLHLMKRNKELGAACGRIHPIGSGPMVWFQKFEYAIGHWLQKSTEHVIGSVLCSPGCFSLFRAKALMEDNVMRKYATRSTEAKHYVQFDQGEDRWLCTLVLQSGYRVEYSAASDSYTHAPETFNEFYNQRRRWIPSTIANIFDLLSTSKQTRKNNENISWLYITYQWILMGSTILGPGTIFLMLVGAFVAAFKIDNWSSFYYNLIPIGLFVTVCFTCKSQIQLIFAAIISAFYGLVMIVVLVGIMIQITEDGWVAPSTILFFVVASQLVIAGLLHPQEWSCLLCGIIYYVTVPSMYLLLIIYSLFNVNNVTWGTRESKPAVTTPTDPGQEEKNKKMSTFATYKQYFSRKEAIDFSFAGLFRCMCCTQNQPSEEVFRLEKIAESLNEISARLDSLEKNSNESIHRTNDIRDEETQSDKSNRFNLDSKDSREDDENSEMDLESSPDEPDEEPRNSKLGNFLVSPHWVQDPDLRNGRVEFLTHDEEVFWNRLIEKYLFPLDEDGKQLDKIAKALKNLRDENLFKFFMLNALFVLVVFLMQLNKNTLHFQWPLGVTYNITYTRDGMEINLMKNYLQLEPIGCLFIAGFVFILFIQFVAMLFHRSDTFMHLLANTSINANCFRKRKDDSGEELGNNDVNVIVEGFQRLAEDNATPMYSRPSTTLSAKKRNTVHALVEDQEKRIKLPTNFDAVFKQNLRDTTENPRITSTGISQRIFRAFEHRRTTLAAQHRQSQLKRYNSDGPYGSVTSSKRLSKNLSGENIYSYDNPGFIAEESGDVESRIPTPRRSQVTFSDSNINV